MPLREEKHHCKCCRRQHIFEMMDNLAREALDCADKPTKMGIGIGPNNNNISVELTLEISEKGQHESDVLLEALDQDISDNNIIKQDRSA